MVIQIPFGIIYLLDIFVHGIKYNEITEYFSSNNLIAIINVAKIGVNLCNQNWKNDIKMEKSDAKNIMKIHQIYMTNL